MKKLLIPLLLVGCLVACLAAPNLFALETSTGATPKQHKSEHAQTNKRHAKGKQSKKSKGKHSQKGKSSKSKKHSRPAKA